MVFFIGKKQIVRNEKKTFMNTCFYYNDKQKPVSRTKCSVPGRRSRIFQKEFTIRRGKL